MTEGVFNCLIDEKRSLAFKKAIKKTIRKGDVVVDMGTGSGILAMFAAKAGAKKVYAVEIDTNNVRTLQSTFLENGLADVIEVIHADVTKVTLPEKVNVIIGEMIATALIEELQVPAMNNILKCAKRNCRVLLSKYTTHLDLVHNNEMYYGNRFKLIRYEYPDLIKLKSKIYSKQNVVSEIDFSKKTSSLKVSKKFAIKITKNGVINGIRLSGKTTFYDNSTLGATYAYDYPIILPIDEISVAKGDTIYVSLSYTISGGLQSVKFSASKTKL